MKIYYEETSSSREIIQKYKSLIFLPSLEKLKSFKMKLYVLFLLVLIVVTLLFTSSEAAKNRRRRTRMIPKNANGFVKTAPTRVMKNVKSSSGTTVLAEPYSHKKTINRRRTPFFFSRIVLSG